MGKEDRFKKPRRHMIELLMHRHLALMCAKETGFVCAPEDSFTKSEAGSFEKQVTEMSSHRQSLEGMDGEGSMQNSLSQETLGTRCRDKVNTK